MKNAGARPVDCGERGHNPNVVAFGIVPPEVDLFY